MATEIRLPDVGENIEKATVLKILVQAGDAIVPDQALIEIETDKATLEVPSEVEGVIQSISVAEGDTVHPGQVLMIAGAEGEKPDEKAPAPESSEADEAPAAREGDEPDTEPAESEDQSSESQDSEDEESAEEEETETAPSPEEEKAPSAKKDAPPKASPAPPPPPPPERDVPSAPTATVVPAAPSVRRLAREIGVDIQQVHGSGPGGRITEEDVKRHAQRMRQGAASGGGATAVPPIQLPDFSRWGDVRRESLPQIRKVISTRMTQSWTTIPHVHHFDNADITELERARKTHNQRLDPSDAPVTVTAVLLRLMGVLLKRHPALNASLDLEASQVVYKEYCHVGLAVDTDRGLLVPVVRDVDRKSVVELATEAAAVARKARNGQLSLDEMQGASFTITNIGGIGGGHFTPIINPPEVAILGVGRAELCPVVVEDHVEERLMLPLSLGYDHRLVDGAVAARFLTEVCRSLSDPAEFLMWV